MQDYRVPEKRKRRGMWPVYGLLMALALGAISYVLGPMLVTYARRQSASFSIGNLTQQQVELLFSGIVFLVLLGVVTLLLAIAVPKNKNNITDKDMVKRKEQMAAEEKMRKKRALEIDRKLREQNRRAE